MSDTKKSFSKGDRVRITGGRQGVGLTGEVFWKGPNKYGPGERLGVRGDDGQTYWTTDSDVEPSDSRLDPTPGEQFDRGARVRFQRDGTMLRGEVFWTGQSRNGPGQRLGVRVEGEEEPTWIDARFVKADDQPSPAVSTPADDQPGDDQPADEMPSDWAPALDMGDMPPAPPLDDALIDAYGRHQDELDG